MAKNDNLGDLLTSVADAIRTKKGTTDPINAQDFDTEILSIESGGADTLTAFLQNEMTEIDLSLFNYPQYRPVGMLAGLTNLNKVILPSGITSIGAYMFYRASGLKTVYAKNDTEETNVVKIPEGVTTIGSYAFYYGGNNAAKLILPSTIETLNTYWAYYAYFNDIDLTRCTKITTLGAYGMPYGKFTKLDVRNTKITTLGTYGVRANTALTEVYLPDTVTTIVDYCFYGCSNLTVVNFGNTRTTIPTLPNARAFYCTSTQAAYKDRKIIVPDALYDQWIVADGWKSTSYNLPNQYIKYSDYYK